ncbi:MAG: Radical SAM domain protein [Candidatus Ozemobacter sibiricus]|uniref:Radical SAM domain protein n=1 Tax=Candidatus Ozemobacter sibiricus TaxID=2268124 RepID=A0A367ZPY8_9BACT|nr:MAG: Radical SAM domain protein [Candidatus Ozemobacter sibiricus]
MRLALVFPPQWDPRQPPLGLAVLAGAARAAGVEVRVWDLNLALYRRLLGACPGDGVEEALRRRLSDPASLRDAAAYLQLTAAAQRVFDERADPLGKWRLFWDTAGGPWAAGSRQAWQDMLAGRVPMPFLAHLRPELAELLAWQPDLIGLSLIADTQLAAGLALVGWLRRQPGGAERRLVLGGDALTYRRTALAEARWLAEWVEAVVLGDGEPFLTAVAAGTPPAQAPNALAWGERAGAAPVLAGPERPPPAFDLLPLDEYLTPALVMPVETARGCPWGRCAFCIHPVRAPDGRPPWRPRPLERVAAEVRGLFAAGHRWFAVVDEAVPPGRLRELAEVFGGLPAPVGWIAYTRLDPGHDAAGLARVRAAGCRKLFVGLETGSDRLLARFRKGITAATARRVLLDMAAAGLAVHLFLMTGFPGEDEADQQATLALLADVWPAFDPFGVTYDLFPLMAEVGTDLWEHPSRYGWAGPPGGPTGANGPPDGGRAAPGGATSRHLVAGEPSGPAPALELGWQVPVLPGPAGRARWQDFRARLDALADRICGPAFGLRQAALSQDALHLLLLAARDS